MGSAPDVPFPLLPYVRHVFDGLALTERRETRRRKMTLAIQRQPRFNKVLLAVGLIAIVAWLAVAMNRVAEPTDAGDSAIVTTHRSPGRTQSFGAIQDDYMVPPAIVARKAANEAALRLQNGYLPPAAVADSEWATFRSIQDGYLPPVGWAPTVETPEQLTTSVRFGPR
jgi:hypothetical protein